MFYITTWNEQLDLAEFYKTAESKGFLNNANKQMLVDSLRKERDWQVWILYYNNKAVGSVAAHTFPEMGEDAFRIAARTCVFTDKLPLQSLRTKNQIITHQHVTAQFLLPVCINWVPKNSKVYITSNENSVGTQKLVHRIFAPAMQKSGQMKMITTLQYRGVEQTVWELYADKFLEELNKYPRWHCKNLIQ